MKIAITGGAGYVGCRLSEYFLKQGHEVICIDWMRWEVTPILNIIDHPNFHLHVMDIRNKEVESVIKSADAVIHLAGIVGYPACDAEPVLAHTLSMLKQQKELLMRLAISHLYMQVQAVFMVPLITLVQKTLKQIQSVSIVNTN